MRKTIIALALLLATVSASAGIKFGIRGGVNVTNVSIADVSGISKTGFYLGPTLKLGLPLGFDIDASLLYNQLEADPDIYIDQADYPTADKDPTSSGRPSLYLSTLGKDSVSATMRAYSSSPDHRYHGISATRASPSTTTNGNRQTSR